MPVTNVELINSVMKGVSLEYQNHIGAVTRSTIADFVHNTDSYRISWNEFIPTLLNKCALPLIHESAAENYMHRFTDTQLYEEGDWVQELGMYLPTAMDYELEGGNPFMYAPPTIATQYHGLNRAQVYPMTINEMQLKKALLGADYAASNMVADLASACGVAAAADEFAIYTRLVEEASGDTDITNVQVPDFVSSPTEQNAISLLTAIRATMQRMMMPSESTQYNPAHLAIPPHSFILFCTPEMSAALTTTAAWTAFNMDKAIELPEIVPVPRLASGVQCLLTGVNFLRGMLTFQGMKQQENPVNLYTNAFYHEQGIYFYSKMVPAVIFSTSSTTAKWDSVPLTTATLCKLSGISDQGDNVTWDSSNNVYNVYLAPGDSIDVAAVLGIADTNEEQVKGAEPAPVALGQDQAAVFEWGTGTYAGKVDTNTFLRPHGFIHVSTEQATTSTKYLGINITQVGNTGSLTGGTLCVYVGTRPSNDTEAVWPDEPEVIEPKK